MKLSTITSTWQQFFFSPIAPTAIALTRIWLGLLLLQSATLHMTPDFFFYYGKNAFWPIDTVASKWWQLDPQFDLLLLFPQDDSWKVAFLDFYIITLVAFILGFCTRLSTILTFFCLLSFHRHCPFNINGGDSMGRLAMFLFCFTNSGDAFSVDNLIRSLREDWRVKGFASRKSAPWAQRMIQLQQCMAYFATFCFKISGQKWVDGTAVYYATRMQEFVKVPLPFFLNNPIAIRFLSWYTLFIEGALGTLIWIKDLRYWVLLGGVILHLGIDFHINLPVFEWTFIALFVTWVDPEDLTKVMDKIKALITKYFGPPWHLAYDGNCIFCVRTVGLLHRLDILGRVELVDFRDSYAAASLPGIDLSRAENEMLLYDGKAWLGGFDAFRRMSVWLPLCWPLTPFLWIPGVAWIGRIIYQCIASHRYMILGGRCQSEVCAR